MVLMEGRQYILIPPKDRGGGVPAALPRKIHGISCAGKDLW